MPTHPADHPEQARQRLEEIQSLYRQWLHMQPALEAAQQQWRQATAIIRRLEDFYEQEYGAYFQAVSDGQLAEPPTEGEYGVMSEDALYNAFGEHQNLAWGWMRQAMKYLDRWGENAGNDNEKNG